MDYINAFWVGGLICVAAQILIDKTKLTPARILVLYVVIGAILGGIGIYDKLVDFAGAGATVPLVGFGNVLAKGVMKAVDEMGFMFSFFLNPKSKKFLTKTFYFFLLEKRNGSEIHLC